MTEDELNRKLLDTFYEYLKENQDWMTKKTHVSGIRLRRILSEIRELSLARREQIREIKKIKPKLKSPKYKKSLSQATGTDQA